MNRDKDSTSGSIGITEIGSQTLGSIGPAQIVGYDTATQNAVNAAISRATNSSRQWTRQTLYAAYRAARPIIEASLRATGQVFTKSQVRASLKPYVAAYVSQYAVMTPPGTNIGATQLQAIAGDICGSFSMPWTAFMPPQVQMAAKLAEGGNAKAKGWLAKLFGGRTSAPAAPATPSAPTPSAAAKPTAASAPVVAAAAATEEKLSGWSWNNNRYGRQIVQSSTPYGSSSYQNQGGQRHRRHHHRRHDQSQQLNPATGQPYSAINPATGQPYVNPATGQPYSAINPSTGQPYSTINPATGQPYYAPPAINPSTGQPYTSQTTSPGYVPSWTPASAVSTALATANPSTQTTYNPYLSQSINPATGQPYGAINPSTGQPYGAIDPTTGQPYVANVTIYGDEKIGSGDSLGSQTLGAWTQKLNPFYWLKSAEERKLVDAERQAWIDNAYNQKLNEKRQVVVDQAQKALVAKQASAAAYAKTAELEAQLKSIESQVLGACSGCSDLGREDILGFSDAGAPSDDDTDTLTPKDVGPVVKKIAKARQLNADNGAALKPIADKLAHGAPLSPDETSKLLILLARNEQLHEFRKNLVSGESYSSHLPAPVAKKLQSVVVMGAVKALTPAEQAMLAQMITLAKQGNPNAKEALVALKAQGYAASMGAAPRPTTPTEQKMLKQLILMAKQGHAPSARALAKLKSQGYDISGSSDTFMGFGITDAFKYATAPIWAPVYGAAKGVQWLGKKAFGGGHGQDPNAARLDRLKAAQQRTRAAQARARAADAQSEAEYRAQQQLAAAADAEADASDAEATAKEAALMTAEAQYLPGQAENSSATDDSQSGDAVATGPSKNLIRPVITPLPSSPKDAELERLMQKATKSSRTNLKAARRQVVATKNPQAARILAASETNTPAGMKLQAAMELYKSGKRGDPKARKAIAAMVAKAKKGDKQALADVYAMKAAQVAVKADTKAAKHIARVAAYRAQTAKVVAARKHMEVAAANKLTQASRAHGLALVAKNERKAAAGDKKAQAIIAKHVALAKQGNKPSQNFVKATALAKHVRTTAPTRAERHRIAQAQRMAAKIAHGDKKATRDARVMVAAAKAGNPNAKRGKARLETGAALHQTIANGIVTLPAVVITAEVVKHQEEKKAADQKTLVAVENKVTKGTASKEEVQAAAKIAATEGDHEKAKELMTVAATTPSAKDELARVATVVTASEAGNLKSQQSMGKALQAAEAGAPEGIEAAGKIAAVQAMHQVQADKPIAPEMKAAVADITAAQAGDVGVQQKIATMQEQATAKVPEAVKYMTYAAGATVVAKALADNPVAHDEWLQKAGVKPEDSSTKNTVMSVDNEVVPFYKADEPLPPVRSTWDMVKASLAALFMTTPDPFQTYREGVQARAHRALGPVTSTGWGEQAAVALPGPDMTVPGLLLAWPIIKLIEYFSDRSDKKAADAQARATATQAVTEAIAKGFTSGQQFINATYLTFGWDASHGANFKQNKQVDAGVPEVRASVVAKVRAGDPKAVAFYRAVLKTGYTPSKSDPGLLQLSGDLAGDDNSPDPKLVDLTKRRLGDIKAAADKGDEDAKKKWATSNTNYTNKKALAAKGDTKAKAIVAVLEATGLFKA